jgi:S1-C subfamily serine protease
MQPVQVPGLLVMHVEPQGPADVAGVLLGDLILGADGTTFEDLDDLQKVLLRKGVGQSFQASLIRGGQKLELPIRIGERPSR